MAIGIERVASRPQGWRSVIVAALISAPFAPALAQAADGDTAIRAIIPHDKPGTEVCFEGAFTDTAVDMQQWPSYAEQLAAVKTPSPDTLAASTVKELPGQAVSRVALYLEFTDGRRARGESWDFDFTVRVTSPGLASELYARSGCAWSGWDYLTEKDLEPEHMLACWIECDGGGMRAVRVPGTGSVDVFFNRLKMQSGCEGGGTYGVGTGEGSNKVAFRLERAPLDACKPLKAWDRE